MVAFWLLILIDKKNVEDDIMLSFILSSLQGNYTMHTEWEAEGGDDIIEGYGFGDVTDEHCNKTFRGSVLISVSERV